MQQRLVNMFSASSSDTGLFLEDLKHAILSPRPKHFYYPGAAAWALPLLYRHCPTSLSDRILSQIFMTGDAQPAELRVLELWFCLVMHFTFTYLIFVNNLGKQILQHQRPFLKSSMVLRKIVVTNFCKWNPAISVSIQEIMKSKQNPVIPTAIQVITSGRNIFQNRFHNRYNLVTWILHVAQQKAARFESNYNRYITENKPFLPVKVCQNFTNVTAPSWVIFYYKFTTEISTIFKELVITSWSGFYNF